MKDNDRVSQVPIETKYDYTEGGFPQYSQHCILVLTPNGHFGHIQLNFKVVTIL